MKKFFQYAIFTALALPLAAQVPVPKDQGITRQQADEIISELKQIRQLLQRQQSKPQDHKALVAALQLRFANLLLPSAPPLSLPGKI